MHGCGLLSGGAAALLRCMYTFQFNQPPAVHTDRLCCRPCCSAVQSHVDAEQAASATMSAVPRAGNAVPSRAKVMHDVHGAARLLLPCIADIQCFRSVLATQWMCCCSAVCYHMHASSASSVVTINQIVVLHAAAEPSYKALAAAAAAAASELGGSSSSDSDSRSSTRKRSEQQWAM